VARVFVSHASEDRECAGQLYQWLVAEGHEVFLDRDPGDGILVGEEWDKRLHERLRWADAVVCVVTSAAVASTWCSAEVGIALSRGSRLLPVRAEPGVDHPLLKSTQYADLTINSTAGRAALAETLRRIDAAGGFGWPDDRSPFPGLRPFNVDQHRVFFGRMGETEELAELLRSPAEHAKAAVLLVVGPSGCGKSSLVRAGLLHVMAKEPGWLTLPSILPGADPVAALARELAAAARRSDLDWTVDHVHHQLAERGLVGLADELLLANPGGPLRRLLIVVDQFEELFTQTMPSDRARFAELLRSALSGPTRVVATLRPEFLDQLLVDSDLAALVTHPYPLRPLRREALRAVIEGPARLAGIGVDDELVARLVADTDSGEALPLLAFTLAQLADGVGRGGQLSQQRYEQLGEVQGALAHQADAALVDATTAAGRRREQVIAGLLRLVTVDEQGRPTRWRVTRNELPAAVTRELDVFVARRLLTTGTDNGSVVVGVAHEAFLSAWPPLAQVIHENVSALRARHAVEKAATEWNDDARPHARLWERGQLAAAVTDTGAHLQARDLVTDRVELSSTARIFLRTSIRRDRFRRRRTITVLSVLLVLAVLAAGYAYTQQRIAVGQRDIALSRQIAGTALALRATNPALAAQLGLTAYRLAPTPEARGSLLSTFGTPYATRLTGHTSTVYAAAFSPNGRTLATASIDQTVRLWDVTDPHHPTALATLTDHADRVTPAVFSPDGRTLATSSADHTARLWDVTDPHHPTALATLTGHTDTIRRLAFNSDGHTLATASADHTARLWDVTDLHHPDLLTTLTGHRELSAAVFSPDGNTLATTGADNPVRLWDITDRRHPRPLPDLTGHTDRVLSAAFSPDRRTLATGSFDNTIWLWDVTDPHHPNAIRTLTGHTSGIAALAFGPDGHTLATGSYDDTVRLWDVTDLHNVSAPVTLSGHAGTVYSVTFSPDGNTLATASKDNTARLWDIRGPVLTGHYGEVNAAAFSPDGHLLAAGTYLTTRLWNVTDLDHPSPLATLTGHTDNVSSVAFSSDGHTLATASLDSTVKLWNITNPHQPTTLAALTGHTNNLGSVAFSPEGHTVATGSADHTARLWDVTDPRQPTALATLTGHTDAVDSVAFSPEGHTVATGSADHTARLWDVTDPHKPTPLATLTGHTNNVSSVAFRPEGHTVATGSADHTARLWDITDPHKPTPLATLTGHTNNVNSVAFSPDGYTLITGASDNTARLWDITDPRHPGPSTTLTGHTEKVYSVAFSPDGHTVATASADHTARLWDTDTTRVTKRICAIAYPRITRTEWSQYLPDLAYQPPCQ
jgi:WD40 repeat protein/energy-coupling factor transporter ATP-binding protein EcfA2